ncbi:MAG: hypothetical protein Q8R61_04835 [Thiobacillus sp.]|nr:hypothetical protein [Thiobacillus sp.]MDP3584428.1 hypothetical protein [Thiobacillus sp.]
MEHREYNYRLRANPEINAIRKAPHNRLANAIEHLGKSTRVAGNQVQQPFDLSEKSTTKTWQLPFIPVSC